jgi:hypothetical protein
MGVPMVLLVIIDSMASSKLKSGAKMSKPNV